MPTRLLIKVGDAHPTNFCRALSPIPMCLEMPTPVRDFHHTYFARVSNQYIPAAVRAFQKCGNYFLHSIAPAGLPLGMPGMGDEMDGAIQQAPQPSRQLSIVSVTLNQAEMQVHIVRFYWAMPTFSATIWTMIWQSVHARTRSAI